MVYKDQLFRMHYDNRRVLTIPVSISTGQEILMDSTPLLSIKRT